MTPWMTCDVGWGRAQSRAVTGASVRFIQLFRGQFGPGNTTPVSESWFDPEGLEVRLTMPYEAHGLAGPALAA